MHKTIYSFFAIFLLGTIIFTSCSVSRISNSNIVTLRLSGWGDPIERQLLQQLVNNFETKYPKIKVKYEVIADQYMDVLKTRLIGETAADVFYLDALEAPALIKPGALEPLDNYITPEFDITDFNPILLNAFQQDGKTYGLPKDFSTLALFYNKKAFRSADLLQPPTSWEELREYSKKLNIDKNKDGKIDQHGFGVAPELARQHFMIKAYGGELVNSLGKAKFASSESLKGLQLVIEQYRQDKSSVQPTDVGTTSGSEIFGQSKAAMVIEGSWLIPT
jgi:multiple sugar transport system substrate-binding protein